MKHSIDVAGKDLAEFQKLEKFAQAIITRGFRKVYQEESDATIRRYDLAAPRPPKNKNNSPVRKYFFATLDGRYGVKIMTGFVDDYPMGPNVKDSVKIIIVDLRTDKLIFKVILHRTKFINERAYNYAWAFAQALTRLPCCFYDDCRHPYELVKAENFEDLPTVCCPNHPNIPTKPLSLISLVLGGNHRKQLENYVTRRTNYAKKMRAGGKNPGAREKRHKPWKRKIKVDNPLLVG